MASHDYLCLAGTEITNAARVLAYMDNGVKPHSMSVRQACACPDLRKILGDDEYVRPDLDSDPPPWVDPNVPESYEFGGLFVTDIEGIDAAPRSRVVTNKLNGGAVVGRSTLGPRTITVTGLLVGSSCCGIDYGLRWLSSALEGSIGCGTSGCGGDDLVYLTCCPEICEDSPTFTSYADCADPYWRTLRNVALVDGPTPTRYVGAVCSCCDSCPAREVQFTLVAGTSYAYREPVLVAALEPWDAGDVESGCVTWSTSADCENTDAEGCPEEADNCLEAALELLGCNTTVPPELPVPVNPCVCTPLTTRTHCIDIPASALSPLWHDAVPDIEIYAGSNALKGVQIRFFPNPLSRDIEDLETCAFCSEINVSVIPAFSTLHIDGTSELATVLCPGDVVVSAGQAVTGSGGGPFVWPTLDCGSPYVMCVSASSSTIAADAGITVRVVSREA